MAGRNATDAWVASRSTVSHLSISGEDEERLADAFDKSVVWEKIS